MARNQFFLFALILVASALPILLTTHPPLIDYPSHLVQVFVLSKGADDVNIAKMFEPDFTLVPNLAFYVIGNILTKFLDVQIFGKLFLLVIIVITITGVAFINAWVNGRASIWALPAAAVCYSNVLHWGFLNFLFAIGLSLWGVGFWLRWRDNPSSLDLTILVVLAVIIVPWIRICSVWSYHNNH